MVRESANTLKRRAHSIMQWTNVGVAGELQEKTFLCYLPSTHSLLHTHTHTSMPLTVVGAEYSWRNERKHGPSWPLELICQVGDPPIPVFLSIWWAPVCHVPVHSVCPKQWLPSPKCILQ